MIVGTGKVPSPSLGSSQQSLVAQTNNAYSKRTFTDFSVFQNKQLSRIAAHSKKIGRNQPFTFSFDGVSYTAEPVSKRGEAKGEINMRIRTQATSSNGAPIAFATFIGYPEEAVVTVSGISVQNADRLLEAAADAYEEVPSKQQ